MCGGHGGQAKTHESSFWGKTQHREAPTNCRALQGPGLGHAGTQLLCSTTAPSPEKGEIWLRVSWLWVPRQERGLRHLPHGEGGFLSPRPASPFTSPPRFHSCERCRERRQANSRGRGGRWEGLGCPQPKTTALQCVSGVRVEDRPGGPCPAMHFINKQ